MSKTREKTKKKQNEAAWKSVNTAKPAVKNYIKNHELRLKELEYAERHGFLPKRPFYATDSGGKDGDEDGGDDWFPVEQLRPEAE